MTPPVALRPLDRRDAHVHRLRALIEIVQALSSRSDLEGLLQQLTVEAARLAAAERATLFLLDPDLGEVVAHTAAGVDFALRMPLTAPGLVTHVARTGDTLNVPDAGADPRWNPSVDNQTGFRTRSVLTVPMRDRDGDIIGVMQLLNKREGTFSAEDEDLLLALGGSAAIAIQNARLQSELEQQFASFIDTLSATLDARDPQTAGHSTWVTACAVLLARELRLDEDRLEFIRLAAQLHDIGKIRVPEAILTKPAALTAEERTIMRDHVVWTRELLGAFDSTVVGATSRLSRQCTMSSQMAGAIHSACSATACRWRRVSWPWPTPSMP